MLCCLIISYRVWCTAYPEGSIFYQRETGTRVKTEWGLYSQTLATKIILHEALKDPLNQKFVLLSETCIPLYPPETIYHVLMKEEKSRARVCDTGVRTFSGITVAALFSFSHKVMLCTSHFVLGHEKKLRPIAILG